MQQKLMLIVNPAAGRGAYKHGLADALQILDAGGWSVLAARLEGVFAQDPADSAGVMVIFP